MAGAPKGRSSETAMEPWRRLQDDYTIFYGLAAAVLVYDWLPAQRCVEWGYAAGKTLSLIHI